MFNLLIFYKSIFNNHDSTFVAHVLFKIFYGYLIYIQYFKNIYLMNKFIA